MKKLNLNKKGLSIGVGAIALGTVLFLSGLQITTQKNQIAELQSVITEQIKLANEIKIESGNLEKESKRIGEELEVVQKDYYNSLEEIDNLKEKVSTLEEDSVKLKSSNSNLLKENDELKKELH